MRRSLILLMSLLGAATVAPLAASAEVLITVDKAAQRMTVSVDGQDRYSWPVSTGVADHDTPSGSYQPIRMDRDHFSREWDDAPMPYSIFFTETGHAIHGTGHVARLGHPASHGCVRLARAKAAELFSLVKAEGLGNTRVVIEGDDLGEAGLVDPDARTARRGRDGMGSDDILSSGVRRRHRPIGADGEALSPDEAAGQPLDAGYDYDIGGLN